MMHLTLRDLLTGLIDYAGLFPPAGLESQSAVGNYSAYRQSEHQQWLGRFILPVARIEEFERAAGELKTKDLSRESEPWRLSVLPGANLEADIRRIHEFNRAHVDDGLTIDTV